jgi:hypothetical protein
VPVVFGLALTVVAVSPAASRLSGQSAEPTFNQQVAPLLFTRCVGCHRPGEIGPMSLQSYAAVRPWARAIKARVVAREMPPWPASGPDGVFANESKLTDAEIETIARWVDAGAPEGSGEPPRPPAFVDGWSSAMGRPPDLVVDSPAFELPADGIIPEFKIWQPSPLQGERFNQSIELRPLNRAVVHHASVFRAELPRGSKLGVAPLWAGGPALPVPVRKDGSPVPEASLPSTGTPLIFYVPAGGALALPKGVGKRVRRGEYLQWTFHLVPVGKPEQVRVRLGLWFNRETVTREAVTWTVTDQVAVNGREVPQDARGPQFPNIAPNDSNYTVVGSMRVKEPITLYAVWPHMHYRGRDVTFTVVDRKGGEQLLLQVPRYRFAWQFTYVLASPRKVEAGSTIRAVAHYDNSRLNRENPDPNAEVVWGPQAYNEMFDPFVELTFDRRVLDDCPMPGRTDRDGQFLVPCP